MIEGNRGGSSGSGGGSSIAGGASQAWVNQNYVSIEFFRKVFKVWAAGATSSDPDVEIIPNDIASTVKNIQAQAGLWTESFLSALGNGGGGGTGGASSLDQLDDVVITSPTDGQALIYNATTQMWVNGTIQSGTDMATVWAALAAATNEPINASHLSGVLADYVTTTSLQTILGDYLTQTAADQRYITIAYFDRLFRAYNGSTLVSHNDTTTTIDNIKAMFGFWTDMYLSALGRNSAATGLGLDNLTDVTINTPTAGQVLQYNATSAKWENATLNIQTVTALANLTDVLLTSPSDYEFLMYQSSKWVNSALKTINGQSLVGSGNISVGGGASGNYLPLSGGMMSGTINYYNSNTGLYYLGTSNTPAGKIIHTAGGNKTIALISRDGDEGGILVGTDCTTIYGAGDGGYVFKVYDADGITDLSGGYPYNKCFLAIRENTGQLMCRDIYSQVENGENNFQIVGLNSSSIIRLIYDDNTYHHFCIYNSSSDFYIEGPNNKTFKIGFRGGSVPFYMTTSGNIGLGDSNPAYRLEVSGNCRVSSHLLVASTDTSYTLSVGGTIYASGAITALSDLRDKLVNENAELMIEQIANAPAFSYYWKDKKTHDELLHVGSSAQYWQAVLPEVVLTAKDKKGTLSMQYGVAALVSAITIARKVVNHETRIKALEAKVN